MSNLPQQPSKDGKITEDFLKRVQEYCSEPLPEGGVRIEQALLYNNELVLVVHEPENGGKELVTTRLINAIKECTVNKISVRAQKCIPTQCIGLVPPDQP